MNRTEREGAVKCFGVAQSRPCGHLHFAHLKVTGVISCEISAGTRPRSKAFASSKGKPGASSEFLSATAASLSPVHVCVGEKERAAELPRCREQNARVPATTDALDRCLRGGFAAGFFLLISDRQRQAQ